VTPSPRRFTVEDFAAALVLPPGAIVNQRVPKKLLIENGAPTPGDKRLLQEHVDQLTWLAALKPSNAGVPAFRDADRAYLEIAIVCVTLRNVAGALAKVKRIAELVHRAIPYPVLLIVDDGQRGFVSMAHLRLAQDGSDKLVLDGEHVLAELPMVMPDADERIAGVHQEALASFPMSHQPRADLRTLYQGWMDTLGAWQAAAVSGVFLDPRLHPGAVDRRLALARLASAEEQIAALRKAAAKEKQIARQVVINQDIKQLQAEQDRARCVLAGTRT